VFGDQVVAGAPTCILGDELVGAYFVDSQPAARQRA
jgi:hypothetical protein